MTPICAPCLFAFAIAWAADDGATFVLPPMAKSPAPGFIRLPAQDVRSDFAVPRFGLAVSAKEFAQLEFGAKGERTNVSFVQPAGMIVHRCTIDPVEAQAPYFYTRCVRRWDDGRWRGWYLNMITVWRDLPSKWRGSFVLNEDFFKIFFPEFAKPGAITTPGQAGFLQGKTHHLKFAEIDSSRSGLEFHATMEVMASDSRSKDFLARHPVQVAFTSEDFRDVMEARTVIKVYYLPSALSAGDDDNGFEVQVVTEGNDPIYEARQRGSVLLVIRMGVGQIFSESLAGPPRLREDQLRYYDSD